MIAIGIDPGTRNLGWGVVERVSQRLRHIDHGVIRVGSDDALSVRLLKIAEALEDVLQRHRPVVGSVEGMFFDKNAQSAAKLGHARGVVLLCLERRNVAVREHAPGRVKRALAGNGHADKKQIARMVQAVLSLQELPPADASDALALAITELRLDSRAHALEERRRSNQRKRIPAALAAALLQAKTRQG